MTDYRKIVLNMLLDRFENSSSARAGAASQAPKRRVLLTKREQAKLSSGLEDPDKKNLFLAQLSDLKDKGCIDFSWVRHEEGNLVDRIWLITEPESLRESYRMIGRLPLETQRSRLTEQIRNAIRELGDDKAGEEKAEEAIRVMETYEPGSSIRFFLKEQADYIRSRGKIPRCFSGDAETDQAILDMLVFMEQNDREQMERLVSSRLYGDSKHWERNIKSHVLSILRQIDKERFGEPAEDDELLRQRGIVRWPEIMEFCGAISVELEDGSVVDYSRLRWGAYINSETIRRIRGVRLSDIRRILSIENKANYIWYISEQQKPDELVLCHGGFYSPSKGAWLRAVAAAAGLEAGSGQDAGLAADLNSEPAGRERNADRLSGSPEIIWFHWSDIDLGGFRIFTRLRKNIVPDLKPYRMDAATLEINKDACRPFPNKNYRRALQKLLEEPDYQFFHEAVRWMLREGLCLEQEQLVLQPDSRQG